MTYAMTTITYTTRFCIYTVCIHVPNLSVVIVTVLLLLLYVSADRGDVIGSSVTLIGVCIILFWPREKDDEGTDSVSDGSSSSVEDYDSTLL